MQCRRRSRRESGFTITELAIVGSLIGILATMAAPTWLRVRRDTMSMLCQQNQRKVYEAASMYEFAMGTTLEGIRNNGTAIRNTLMGSGYIARQVTFECPTSQMDDFDDMHLRYSAGVLEGAACSVLPELHSSDF